MRTKAVVSPKRTTTVVCDSSSCRPNNMQDYNEKQIINAGERNCHLTRYRPLAVYRVLS